MKFGFDLDGTLDHEEIRALAACVLAAGHEVHILTGCPDFSKETWDKKVAKCERLGVVYTELHLCVGDTHEDIGHFKANVLRDKHIPIMIDDSPIYVKQIAHYSNSRILMVVK